MKLEPVELGAERTDADGCRRYRPIAITFDTRNAFLDQEITDEMEQAVQDQWRTNQAAVRMELLAEHGTVDGEEKIDNYKAMGSAPWSVAYEHNGPLSHVRSAFAHGNFYPALVGACALGERIFNHLILELRADYDVHPGTTKRVRRTNTFTSWPAAIEVLYRWGVLTDETRDQYLRLEQLRHASVHFDPTVNAVAREPALEALLVVQALVTAIFTAVGGPPTFIAGTAGASFFSLESEAVPLIKRVFLPRSALVSPCHGMRPQRDPGGAIVWTVLDDVESDETPLTDEQFCAALEYQ